MPKRKLPVGPKLAQIRALAEPHRPKRSAHSGPRAVSRAEAAAEASKATTPIPAKPAGHPVFDRVAYQRIYCRLRRRHGVPVTDWPPEALAELRRVSVGRENRTPPIETP